MANIARTALVMALALAGLQPAKAEVATKCIAEFKEGNWPYYSTTTYTPNTTNFRFVCPGVSGKQTIPQLYQIGWSMVGLPWKEPAFGGSNHYAVWMRRP